MQQTFHFGVILSDQRGSWPQEVVGLSVSFKYKYHATVGDDGGLAQLVERVLSMHEVSGSIPEFSSGTLLPVREDVKLTMIWYEE